MVPSFVTLRAEIYNLFSNLTDITYASLAKPFNQSLVHHPETLKRMAALCRIQKWTSKQTEDQRAAQQRMALFPDKAEVIFVGEDIWVVSYLAWRCQMLASFISITASSSIRRRTICIPSLFQRLLTALTPFLPLPPKSERPLRIPVFTESHRLVRLVPTPAESQHQHYLTGIVLHVTCCIRLCAVMSCRSW